MSIRPLSRPGVRRLFERRGLALAAALLLLAGLVAGPARALGAPAPADEAAPAADAAGAPSEARGNNPAGQQARKPAASVAVASLGVEGDSLDAVMQNPVPYPNCPLAFGGVGTFPVLPAGVHTFDTDALTLDGNAVPGAVASGGVAVFTYLGISVPAGVTLRAVGSRPMALMAHGPITVAGTIDVDGSNATPTAPGCQPRTASPGGAGGGAGGLGLLNGPGIGAPGVGPGGGGQPGGNTAGGGGGGFGGAGGAGGANGAPGGLGGATYGNLATSLQGGSGGSAGSATSSCSAASGGGAGGAVLLYSPSTITIAGGGLVSANGGNGALSDTGASGGGSGGGITLIAQTVTNSGTLRANGGTGGSGGCCGGGGAGGGGRIHISAFGITAGTTQVNGGGASSGNAGGAAAGTGVVTQDLQGLLYGCDSDLSVSKSCYARLAIPGVHTQDADVLYAGQQWVCDITVRHRFIDTVPNVPGVFIQDLIVNDDFPANLTYVVSTVADDMEGNVGNPPTCTAPPLVGPGTVNCTGLDLETGGTRTFQLAFLSNPSFVANAPSGELPVSNDACVQSTQPVRDVVASNNCDNETDIVKDLADLKITKLVEPYGSVRAGQIFTYTIYVDNLGPSTARRVVISDTLLSSGNVSIQSCAFSVSQGGGAITQFTCTTGPLVSTQFGTDIGTFATNLLEPLTPDSQGRLRASFRLVANQDIKVTNTARVSSLTPDYDMTNNMAMVSLDVTGVTNLAVTKQASGEEQQVNQAGLIFNSAIFGQAFPTAPNYFVSTRVTAGRRIEYVVNVSNTGPSRAERVVLTDRLPLGTQIYQGSLSVTYDPAGAAPAAPLPAGTCATGTPGNPLDKLTCGLGTMQVGDTAVLRFQVVTDSTLPACSVLENDAVVTSDTLDLVTTNNLAFAQNTVLAAADMLLTKSSMGEVVTGVNPLTGALVVVDTPNAVTAGMLLRYELSATNQGPSQATNVTIREVLPATNLVDFVRADGAECRPDDVQQNILFCNLGTIPAGGRETFDVYVRVKSGVPVGTNLANSALIQSNPTNTCGQPAPVAPIGKGAVPQPKGAALDGVRAPAGTDQVVNPNLPMVWDPVTANNAAANNAVVNAVADVGGGPNPNGVGAPVGLTKVDVPAEARLDRQQEPDLALAGKEHRYRITFGNAGPSDATGVTLVDALDFKQLGILGETFLRCEAVAPTDSATCSFTAPNTVTVTNFSRSGTTVVPGTIPAGNSYQLDLVVLVDPGYVLDATDLIATDRATITTTAVDPNAANNTDTEDTEIIAEADLAVVKTDIFGTDPNNGFLQCDPVAPGGMLTYDLTVTNRGPSDAAAVLLEDRLPANGVVLDPAQVQVSFLSGNGRLLGVRDDGRIQILVGRDLNNRGEEQLGRLNTGSSVTVRIQAMVQTNVPCGTVLRNQATVRTMTNYGAVLEGANEVPAVATAATGVFSSYFDPMTRQLFWFVDVTGIASVINGANIHRGAAGVNGAVAYDLLVNAGVTTFTAATPIGGVLTLTAADVTELLAGRLYVNVRTTSFPNGEIRGQILTTAAPGNRPRTPTTEVNPADNQDDEDTTIRCPKLKLVKTVSYNGQCPGQAVPTINLTGQPVTFCFEITNTGDTHLDSIRVVDELTTRSGGKRVIFDEVITSGADPKVPLAPGETVRRQVTVDQLLKDWSCGISTDKVTATGVPVNSGRTIYPCLPLATADSTAYIEVPCAGVDFRIQLPILDKETCETWIQVQNLGDKDAKGLLVVWGEPSFCPPQAAGPLKAECTGILRPGSAWSFALAQLPAGSRSAVLYSLNATTKVKDERGNLVDFGRLVCSTVFDQVVGDYDEWALFDEAYRLRGEYRGLIGPAGEQLIIDFGANPGEPLAATVNRKCPDPVTPNAFVNAAYTGISSDQEGARDPRSGSYTFYTPLVLVGRGGLSSILNIQNSGLDCTSLEIWFKAQDDCMRPVLGDVLTVSPGETVRFDPSTVVGPDWMGSAWIRSTQPLGIVVDTIGPNHFTSYNGVAADVETLGFTYGDQVAYAPLIYNQMQGWDTLIQVQNHSAVVAAKVKVYFLDQSGDVITTIVDWICPRGSQSFFLPTIAALPGNWRGSARIESQIWWTPGTTPIDAPYVSAVVLSERWSDAARTVRRESLAYNAQGECLLYDWQVGHGAGGTESGAGALAVPLLMKQYRGITSEIAITNLVAKPGFTDFAVFVYDQNGLLDYVCEKLHDRQVEYIDLSTWGWISANFNGSMVISATYWEHEVFDPEGKFVRNLVGLGATAVERVGGVSGGPDLPGDESKAFEAFPIFNHFLNEGRIICPGQPTFDPIVEDFSASSTTAVTIPNAGPLPQTVSQSVTVAGKPADCNTIDVDLAVNITHGWFGDLDLTLSHGTTTATMFNNSVVPFCTNSANVIGTLDDDAATSMTVCSTPMLGGAGQKRKTESGSALDAFNGSSPNGAWTLTVSDLVIGGQNQAAANTLNSWSVSGQCRYRRLSP